MCVQPVEDKTRGAVVDVTARLDMDSFHVSERDLRSLIDTLAKQALLLEEEGSVSMAAGLWRRANVLKALVDDAA